MLKISYQDDKIGFFLSRQLRGASPLGSGYRGKETIVCLSPSVTNGNLPRDRQQSMEMGRRKADKQVVSHWAFCQQKMRHRDRRRCSRMYFVTVLPSHGVSGSGTRRR